MRRSFAFAVSAAFALAGCTAVTTQEASFAAVKAQTARDDLVWIKSPADAAAVRTSVEALLATPLTQENAVRIALLNNRELQQTYEEIGISQSALIQAGLLRNPILGYAVGKGEGVTTSAVGIEIAFLDLLWIPLRQELAGLELDETRQLAGDAVRRHVRDTTIAYIDARTARSKVVRVEEILASAEVSAQLAARQHAAGNLAKRDLAKIGDEYARIRIDMIKLRQEAASARERLNRAMGLYGDQTRYMLPDDDGAFIPVGVPVERLESDAIASRLDMQAARTRVEYAAKEAGYTRATRWAGDAAVGIQHETSTIDPTLTTYGIQIPLPLFDTGQGRLSAAQARYNQSVHRLYETAVNIRSQVREAYADARYAYDIADEYRESVVKNNQTIVRETGKYYNGMLDGIYELLQDQRRLSEAVVAQIEAIGEYRKRLAQLEYVVASEKLYEKDSHAQR